MSKTFKLSKSTRKILDNFSWINDTAIFRPGNVITFVSKHRGIIAFAEVEETFPQRFVVWASISLKPPRSSIDRGRFRDFIAIRLTTLCCSTGTHFESFFTEGHDVCFSKKWLNCFLIN